MPINIIITISITIIITDPTALLLSEEDMSNTQDIKAEAQEHTYQAALLEEELGQMSVNLETIEAYRAKQGEFDARMQELEQITAQRDEVCCTCITCVVGCREKQ